MIRSSMESNGSSGRDSNSQFTPAVRQFSAPKTVKDTSSDVITNNESSEFGRPNKGKTPTKGHTSSKNKEKQPRASKNQRYSEDEDEDNHRSLRQSPPRSAPNGRDRDKDKGDRGDRQDWDDQGRGSSAPSSRGKKKNHYGDEDDYGYDRGARVRGNNGDRDNERRGGDKYSSRNRYNDDNDEEYGRGGHGREGGRGGRGGREDRYKYTKDRDREKDREKDRDRGRDTGKWGGKDERGRGEGHQRHDSHSSNSDYHDDRDSRNDRDRRGNWTGVESDRDDDRSLNKGKSGKGKGQEYSGEQYGTTRDEANRTPRAGASSGEAIAPKVEVVPPDLSNMQSFLRSPLPKKCGVVQCYIRRNKNGTNKLFPIYSLYLKEGDVFLMASKKRPKNKTSNYLISSDPNDLNRSGSNYIGKLRSNFVGTEFQVFDDGVNPKDEDEAGNDRGGAVRCELGAVMYAANVLGSRGPRKMQVAIPGLDENEQIIKWRDSTAVLTTAGAPPSAATDDMLTRMKDRNFRDLVYLINKPPRWNEQVGAYVLNFNGRVTMASVKNFQLVDPDEQSAVVLQFGRVGKDEFTMDMQWPVSPYQAFAITLSSFDSKIACD